MNERTFKSSDAHKLEDPERLNWLPPADVIGNIPLTPETVIADIGAGTGYFAIPLAHRVRSLFAVDLQPEMLELLGAKLHANRPIHNIELVLGSARATNLSAACCDLVFYANVWHELDDLDAVLKETRRVLRAGGRLVILDWRPDVDRPPGPPLDHRVPPERLRAMLEVHGWVVGPASWVGCYHYLVIADSA